MIALAMAILAFPFITLFFIIKIIVDLFRAFRHRRMTIRVDRIR